MTILWIYNLPLIPEAGGTERITSLIAKGLSQRGHKCLGILEFKEGSTQMVYEGHNVEDLYEFLKEYKVDVIINQIAYSRWLLRYFLERGGAKWHAEGGKIISCLHFDPKPTSDLYLFKSKRDKKFRDYINIAKAFLLKSYYRKRQEKRTDITYNWVYDNSDHYITLSATHFPYFRQVTQRDEYQKLTAINNPLTFDDISTDEILNEKKKVVLVCSRMDEYQKRISLILRAWKKLQSDPIAADWTLNIIGDGPDLEFYKSYANKKRLKNICFEGRQSPEPYYREADIFLMTSTGIEGWGLTLTESLQRGVVPVVMNTCPVYSDIITDGYNGFLTQDNVADLMSHVLMLMKEQEQLRKMQRNALSSASRFTLDKTMMKWGSILNKLNK